MSYTYIASPYTHDKEHVMHDRYLIAASYTASLLRLHHHCYSPIVHCHELAVKFDLPRELDFWKRYNTSMLRHADELYVLCIPGWKESRGVQFEIDLAEQLGLPIRFIEV